MSFFRYPGGKRKLRTQLLNTIETEAARINGDFEYREPFFGGGGIGTSLMQSKQGRMWINDKDSGIAALWTSVINHSELLKQKVMEFVPTVDSFYKFCDDLRSGQINWGDENSIVEFGFMKLVVHQTSYSGLGLKSGGPLGGRDQKSPYKIDCRWSPKYICRKIDNMRALLRGVNIRDNRCWNEDFRILIEDDSYPAVLYVDPPYFVKGNDLYHVGFDESDHLRLASYLKNTNHFWVLSYDVCEEVLDLYSWAKVEKVIVNYSITALGKINGERESRWKYEYVITRA